MPIEQHVLKVRESEGGPRNWQGFPKGVAVVSAQLRDTTHRELQMQLFVGTVHARHLAEGAWSGAGSEQTPSQCLLSECLKESCEGTQIGGHGCSGQW